MQTFTRCPPSRPPRDGGQYATPLGADPGRDGRNLALGVPPRGRGEVAYRGDHFSHTDRSRPARARFRRCGVRRDGGVLRELLARLAEPEDPGGPWRAPE